MKKYKTNSKHVKNLVKQYILETVHNDKEEVYVDFKDAANRLNSEFKRVANHKFNLQRLPNNVDRFLDYLQGLPFWFPMYDDDIEEFLNSLGINPENKEFESSKMWNLYALLIYREIEKY
jgi:hypothetical protein